MSKLEDIRRALSEMPGLVRKEESVRRRHLRREGWYESMAFRIAPEAPLLTSKRLQAFSADMTKALMPIGPASVTRCYEYAETYRDVIKTASLYFVEPLDGPADGVNERRISVTVYPCAVMAEHQGIRGLIEIRHYPCPKPCQEATKCTFRGYDDDPLSSVRTALFR